MRPYFTFLAGLLILFSIPSACNRRPDEAAVEVVKTFAQESRAGHWEAAMALVDFDAKCRSMYGDIYDKGAPEEQRVTQDILKERLRFSTQQALAGTFRHRDGEFLAVVLAEDRVEVTQTLDRVSLLYTLHRRDDRWLVVDRTHIMNGERPNVKMLTHAVLMQVRKRLGHEPTLAELNQHLPEVMKHVRQKTIEVK